MATARKLRSMRTAETFRQSYGKIEPTSAATGSVVLTLSEISNGAGRPAMNVGAVVSSLSTVLIRDHALGTESTVLQYTANV
jgi:hypothetical protein